ncbi:MULTISPECIES: RNA-binding S4 domain-containing protein [Nitrosomonas]|uniref:RNA-binding protein n=1 Tax=Nitrosomonas communis TaxID=44574 RepID=A0A0F7KJW0_9PROT|nr:RNA-binding protein [Nitrosomonas communis]TYP90863.1 ribosome-associated heat shock protein Hsp15 [Nitrosomonas communis]
MMPQNDVEKFRIDKWLYAARFFKTRSLAAEAIERGKVYINGARVKPAKIVAIGDMLTIRIAHYQYEIKVLALSNRRGPASEAQQLYQETEASRKAREVLAEQTKIQSQQFYTKGRPTKRDRREIDRFKNRQ